MQLLPHAAASAALPSCCWTCSSSFMLTPQQPSHCAAGMQLFLPAAACAALPARCWTCSSSSRLPPLRPSLHAADVHHSRHLPLRPLLQSDPSSIKPVRNPPAMLAALLSHAMRTPWHTLKAPLLLPHPVHCPSSDALLDTWATAASRTAAASVPPAQRRSPFNEHWLNCKLIGCPDGTQQPSTSPCTAATRAAAPRVPPRPERRRGLSPPDWRFNLPRCFIAARR
jgi:hypothetical protein